MRNKIYQKMQAVLGGLTVRDFKVVDGGYYSAYSNGRWMRPTFYATITNPDYDYDCGCAYIRRINSYSRIVAVYMNSSDLDVYVVLNGDDIWSSKKITLDIVDQYIAIFDNSIRGRDGKRVIQEIIEALDIDETTLASKYEIWDFLNDIENDDCPQNLEELVEYLTSDMEKDFAYRW